MRFRHEFYKNKNEHNSDYSCLYCDKLVNRYRGVLECHNPDCPFITDENLNNMRKLEKEENKLHEEKDKIRSKIYYLDQKIDKEKEIIKKKRDKLFEEKCVLWCSEYIKK